MKQCRIQAWPLILVVLMWLPMACSSKRGQRDIKALNVFSDFTFVGTAPYTGPEGKQGSPTIVLPESEPRALPTRLEFGTAYVFRHRRPIDDEKLALVELPSRLRMTGLKILQAPQSSRDLMKSYIGGPFFVIKFTDGRHTGLLTNRLSGDYQKQADSGWVGEDYILAYTQ